MTTTETRLLTADDLLRLDAQGVRGELIRGALCETMPVGKIHNKVAAKLIYILMAFVFPRRLGTVMSTDLGIRLERDPDTVRAPDVSFFSTERMALDDEDPSYSDVVPELVVEVTTPSDSRREVDDKARMWRSHGVRLVWAAYPEMRTVNVYGADGTVATLGEGDTIDGGEVLPGFSCPVSEVFRW